MTDKCLDSKVKSLHHPCDNMENSLDGCFPFLLKDNESKAVLESQRKNVAKQVMMSAVQLKGNLIVSVMKLWCYEAVDPHL